MSAMRISDDLAAELHMRDDGSQVGEWRQVGKQLIRTGRWTEHYWLVVTNGAGCWGVEYEDGLTEDQENRYPWEEGSGAWCTAPLADDEGNPRWHITADWEFVCLRGCRAEGKVPRG